MIRIKANICLYKGENKRQTPFYSGYRPIFKFNNTQTSGAIELIDKEKFNPDEESIVWITFLNKEYLIDSEGEYILDFTFSEVKEILGRGNVLQVYECNEIDLKSKLR